MIPGFARLDKFVFILIGGIVSGYLISNYIDSILTMYNINPAIGFLIGIGIAIYIGFRV